MTTRKIGVACGDVRKGDVIIATEDGNVIVMSWWAARQFADDLSDALGYPREVFDDWVPPAKDDE
jgi:hypothetical protein